MKRIICESCKNAFLEKKGDLLVCPGCGAEFPAAQENTLLGVQYYREGDVAKAADFFMKGIVADGSDYRALFYKALCDAKTEEGSLGDTYDKLLNAFADVPDGELAAFLTLADDECRALETAAAEGHVRAFEDADADGVKAGVEAILALQAGADGFRKSLTEHVGGRDVPLTVNFPASYLVSPALAQEVADTKFGKIKSSIEDHTVFTGILANDIKNLEIYYRCVVMFFEKSKDKYDFLMQNAENFVTLDTLLADGGYSTLTGTSATSEKLKKAAYGFFEESLREHDEDKGPAVVVAPPEEPEEPEEDDEEEEEEEEEDDEDEEPDEEEAVTEDEDTADAAETVAAVEAGEISAESDAGTDDAGETEPEESGEEAASGQSAESGEEPAGESADQDAVETAVEGAQSESDGGESEETAPPDETVEDGEEQDAGDDAQGGVDGGESAVDGGEGGESSQETAADGVSEDAPEEPTTMRKPKQKKKAPKVILLLLLLVLLAIVGWKYGPMLVGQIRYNSAAKLMEEQKYTEAQAAFAALGDFSDSAQKAKECEEKQNADTYEKAAALEKEEKFDEARALYAALGEYSDSATRVQACDYGKAKALLKQQKFDEAADLFKTSAYGDWENMVKECAYQQALALAEQKKYDEAVAALTELGKYSDAAEQLKAVKFAYVKEHLDKKDKKTVQYLTELAKAKYQNAADLRDELLGSPIVMAVNTDEGDYSTNETNFSSDSSVYCHATVNDEAYWGKTLTLEFVTAYGFTSPIATVQTVSESNKTLVIRYPATNLSNYTVTFNLLDEDGTTIATATANF